MTSVLHPVGPEQPQTYWRRRVAVVVAVLIVLVVIVWAVWPRSTQTAGPAPTPDTSSGPTSAVSSAPGASPTPGSSTSTRPSARPPSSSASASPAPSGSAPSTPASKSPASPSSPSNPTSPAPAAVAACGADDVRVTLTGPSRVKAEDKTTFKVSVINGSAATCTIDLKRSTFEVKIFSGADRIWSTDDCAAWLTAKPEHQLAPEDAYAWSIPWTGQRSATGCQLTGGLRSGTYVATAQLTVGSAESKPVQVVMRLR